MKWYWAEYTDSERWENAGESREEAIAFGKGERGAVAHEREDQISDEKFWKAVAAAICARLDMVDEELGEEGWIDFEDGWAEFDQQKLEEAMAKWLPTTGLVRPEWRTIEAAELVEADAP